MLAFITSLRHPDTARDYRKAVSLLKLTILSICAQKNPNFVIVVVCNKRPDLDFEDQRVHFHVVDFPPPEELANHLRKFGISSNEVTSYPQKSFPKKADKGFKILAGALYARRFDPKYLFIVDCDDWINTRLVDFILKSNDQKIWFVDSAFLVNFTDKTYMKRSGVCRFCGSTIIYETDFFFTLGGFSQQVDENSTQMQLLEATSSHFIHAVCGNHVKQYSMIFDYGLKPSLVPFPAICYVLGTGENAIQDALVDDGYPIDEGFSEEFGIEESFVSRRKARIDTHLKQIYRSLKSYFGWLVFRFSVWRKRLPERL